MSGGINSSSVITCSQSSLTSKPIQSDIWTFIYWFTYSQIKVLLGKWFTDKSPNVEYGWLPWVMEVICYITREDYVCLENLPNVGL